MLWQDIPLLQNSRTLEGAIWWGTFAAIDQWTKDRRPGKSRKTRPTDRELVEAARAGNLDGPLLQRFAVEYEVIRSIPKKDGHGDDRLKAVSANLKNVYHGKDASSEDKLAEMWIEAINEVEKAMGQYGKTAKMRSLCMKVLWLYHPEHATMWDSYVVRAMKHIHPESHYKDKIKKEDEAAKFLKDFEKIFDENRDRIDESIKKAEKITGHRYRYPRRVLDKALWLQGVQVEAAEIMNSTLGRDEGIRAATEQRFPELKPHPQM